MLHIVYKIYWIFPPAASCRQNAPNSFSAGAPPGPSCMWAHNFKTGVCEFHTKASEFIAQLVGGTSIVDRWQAHWWNCALFDLPPFWFDDGYKLALGTRRSTLKLAVFSVRRGRTGRVRATCTRPAPKSFLWVPLLTSFLSMPSLVWSFFLDIWWKIRKW